MGECIKMSEVVGRREESVAGKSRKAVALTMHDAQRTRQAYLDSIYQPQNARYLYQKLPAGSWKGRRCFIIGGGESLRGFDFGKLKGELVITVNRTFEDCPWSVVNICQDSRVFGYYEDGDLGVEAKAKWTRYKGFKTWLNVQQFPFPEDIYFIDPCHSSDFSFSHAGGMPAYGNSGLNALCLAACLGADPIYLLGFDMHSVGKKTVNYHGGYPDTHPDEVYKDFISDFKDFSPRMQGRGRVINLNPESALTCFEFGKFEDIKPIRRPIVVSFFTKGTGYELEIKRLEESCIKFGLEHDFVGAENRGSWRANIHGRIQILRDFLDKHVGRDILYVDADGAFMHYPELLDNFEADFAAVKMDRARYWPENWNKTANYRYEILGGTMFFANNKRSRALLEAWEELDAPMATSLSQVHLIKAMEMVPGLKYVPLPDNYCQIFDIMASAGEPIIEHYQASRRSILAVKIDSKGKIEVRF
jgi:hypothetical protein